MVRLSKSKRDALKAAGDWPLSEKEVYAKKCAAGAAEFARLSMEAFPDVDYEDDDDEYVPVFNPKVVPFYPDMFSCEEVYHEIAEEEVIPPYPIVESPTHDQAMRFFFSMAAKATETFTGDDALQPVPTVVTTDVMAKYLHPLGEFQIGQIQFKYADLNSFVKACLRSAVMLSDGYSIDDAFSAFKMPTSESDACFRFNLATKLVPWFKNRGFAEVCLESMTRSLFSGFVPNEVAYAFHDIPDEYAEIVRFLFGGVASLTELQARIRAPPLNPILKEFGFNPDLEVNLHCDLHKLIKIATDVSNAMTPTTGSMVGPFSLPYGEDASGDASQLVKPMRNGRYLVPGCLDANVQTDTIALSKVSSFRVHPISPPDAYGRLIPVWVPDIPITMDDLLGFPRWKEV